MFSSGAKLTGQTNIPIQSPKTITFTNEYKERETLLVWASLPAANGNSLGQNMTFRSVSLKRAVFRKIDESGTAALRSFEVTELHPDVLAFHRIDAGAQVRMSEDEAFAYQKKQAYDLALWNQREAERQRKLAEEAVARLEAQRLAEIAREKTFKEDLELRRVEAEERKADAEMIKAQTPEPGIIIQQNQSINRSYRYPYWR